MPYKWNEKEFPPINYPNVPQTPEDNKYFLKTEDWNGANKQIETLCTPDGETDLYNKTTKKIDAKYLPVIPTIAPANSAEVATGTDPAKYITPATLPIKSVTTGNGLTLTNKVLSMNKEWLTQSEVEAKIPVKSVTSSNGLTLSNGVLSLSKGWLTQNEVDGRVNTLVPQSSTTTVGKVQLATTEEVKVGTDPSKAITPQTLKAAIQYLKESGELGVVKKIIRLKVDGMLENVVEYDLTNGRVYKGHFVTGSCPTGKLYKKISIGQTVDPNKCMCIISSSPAKIFVGNEITRDSTMPVPILENITSNEITFNIPSDCSQFLDGLKWVISYLNFSVQLIEYY